jgi:hypothetical protein
LVFSNSCYDLFNNYCVFLEPEYTYCFHKKHPLDNVARQTNPGHILMLHILMLSYISKYQLLSVLNSHVFNSGPHATPIPEALSNTYKYYSVMLLIFQFILLSLFTPFWGPNKVLITLFSKSLKLHFSLRFESYVLLIYRITGDSIISYSFNICI